MVTRGLLFSNEDVYGAPVYGTEYDIPVPGSSWRRQRWIFIRVDCGVIYYIDWNHAWHQPPSVMIRENIFLASRAGVSNMSGYDTGPYLSNHYVLNLIIVLCTTRILTYNSCWFQFNTERTSSLFLILCEYSYCHAWASVLLYALTLRDRLCLSKHRNVR